ncbi:hypothetical protein Tco_0662336 [Tanacetum coccineum]
MSGTLPPPPVTISGNTGNPNRVKAILQTNNTSTNNVAPNVVNVDFLQLLDSKGGSHVIIVPPFDVDDFTIWKDRFLVYLDGLEPYLHEILENGPYVPKSPASTSENILIKPQNLPKKWLSMNQTQRANDSIKNDTLATLYGKYNYEEELIDQIYEFETKRFNIKSSTSKALIFNTHFHDSDSDVEEDTKSSSEFLADLNAEFHDRALLSNQKRFYKRS